MTDLGSVTHYLRMEITHIDTLITIIQTVYIDYLLANHQISNYNAVFTFMIKRLYLLFTTKEFTPHNANIIAYKHFTRSVQWLACQTQLNIIQAVAKISKYNVKFTDQY